MLDNLLTSLRNQANTLSDNLKSKSRRLAMNFSSLKNRLTKKESKGKTYYTVSNKEIPEYYDNDYLSPRACSMNYNTEWPSINDNMEWVPYVPPSLDEHNILDRFIKVITVNDYDRRTDREEIRRRLAMGSEDDYYNDRPGRKPSLQARLQSGMNLQICFMNETVSDNESPSSDSECTMTNPKQLKNSAKNANVTNVTTEKVLPPTRPATLSIGQPLLQPVTQPMTETDFFARQARLQTEARMALAQAKEMARMQMEIERQRQKKSPITEMVRHSLEKVGIPFPEDRRRLSRQILTEMNVAQLQVIVNDLHTQIESLNESLVKFLMDRDDLHMEQDSMLVDIEDLTRYLGAKEQSLKEQTQATTQNNNLPPPSPAPSSPLAALNSTVKPHLHRIASLVKK
ncbi:schwannomin interacting protein 1 [Holotrichia oblita]|uniref:Schwannomin interacting protein 1 n=1 Tax=Holotrichia oblita TaxID=644536 RepID=A0ACB9TD75_HOLOL|nr:schwannomin interacting protein 1 [Holotrichia oblita]